MEKLSLQADKPSSHTAKMPLRPSPHRVPKDTSKGQHAHHATATGAITKTSKKTKKDFLEFSKIARSGKDWRWSPRDFAPGDLTSFEHEHSVLLKVSQISGLTVHVPRIAKADAQSQQLILCYPRVQWKPLSLRVKVSALDLQTLLEIKEELCSNIELLYAHGVAYCFNPDCLFLIKLASSEWLTFLADWTEARLYTDPDSNDTLQALKAEQLKKIDTHFRELQVILSKNNIERRSPALSGNRQRWILKGDPYETLPMPVS